MNPQRSESEHGVDNTVVVRHGTTRLRAESILLHGPNPDFIEPHGSRAEAFCAAPAAGPFPLGAPEMYARAKASRYSDEGGAAIVEVEVPLRIAEQALLDVPGFPNATIADGGELRFELGYGLEELIRVWSELPKRIVPVS